MPLMQHFIITGIHYDDRLKPLSNNLEICYCIYSKLYFFFQISCVMDRTKFNINEDVKFQHEFEMFIFI